MILIAAEILLYQHARYKNLFDSVCLHFFSGGGGGRIVYCRSIACAPIMLLH